MSLEIGEGQRPCYHCAGEGRDKGFVITMVGRGGTKALLSLCWGGTETMLLLGSRRGRTKTMLSLGSEEGKDKDHVVARLGGGEGQRPCYR